MIMWTLQWWMGMISWDPHLQRFVFHRKGSTWKGLLAQWIVFPVLLYLILYYFLIYQTYLLCCIKWNSSTCKRTKQNKLSLVWGGRWLKYSKIKIEKENEKQKKRKKRNENLNLTTLWRKCVRRKTEAKISEVFQKDEHNVKVDGNGKNEECLLALH